MSEGEVLTFKFAAAYPNWLDGAGAGVRLVLESQWDNRSYNRSGLPTFTYSATGTGIVTYSSAAESPCSDVGNTCVARMQLQLGPGGLQDLRSQLCGVRQGHLGLERVGRLRRKDVL